MSIDNREASILMAGLAPSERDRLIAAAGDVVIDMRDEFAREQRENGAAQ